MIKNYLEQLKIQRWDDHRYYHHSRINQSLHFVSALSFLFAYLWMFVDPMISALVGWLVSMTSRQAGHFFFEPHDYDHINQATHEYKEDIKVGYNLQRKVVLMSIWARLLFRTVHLFFIRDVETGLVWMTKILTDPFHDLMLYRNAPMALMRGELMDPGLHLNPEHTLGLISEPTLEEQHA